MGPVLAVYQQALHIYLPVGGTVTWKTGPSTELAGGGFEIHAAPVLWWDPVASLRREAWYSLEKFLLGALHSVCTFSS